MRNNKKDEISTNKTNNSIRSNSKKSMNRPSSTKFDQISNISKVSSKIHSNTKEFIDDNISIISQKKKLNKNSQLNNITNELDNMKSVLIQYSFLNELLDDVYENQKNFAYNSLNLKIEGLMKLREVNFQNKSKINSINTITKIEEIFQSQYSKVYSLETKINHILEILDDFKINVNFSLDKLYLEDNIICDEKIFQSFLEKSIGSIQELFESNKESFNNIEELRSKIECFHEQLVESKNLQKEIQNLLQNYTKELLQNNMETLNIELNEQNSRMEIDLLNL